MGHHIDSEGRFQSDKYPDLPPDALLLKLDDPEARAAITLYVTICKDRELAGDLIQRMRVLRFEPATRTCAKCGVEIKLSSCVYCDPCGKAS